MSGLSPKTLSSLEELRTTTQDLFDDQKLSANQIIRVDSQILPARIIAFQYYGDSTLGPNIAKLNEDINVSFLGGNIEILTE